MIDAHPALTITSFLAWTKKIVIVVDKLNIRRGQVIFFDFRIWIFENDARDSSLRDNL